MASGEEERASGDESKVRRLARAMVGDQLLMEPVTDMRFSSGQAGIKLGNGEYLVSRCDGNDRAQRWAGATEGAADSWTDADR